MSVRTKTFVIVGASLAGAKAAEGLRGEGFDGRVVLIGAEPERPYERPPLSKDYLRCESEREKVFVHEAAFYADQEIELRVGEQALALDRDSREVVLDSGERLGFDRLLLATGAEPVRFDGPGSDLEGVHYLRTLADCEALRERLVKAEKLVVVGGGWIGSEVAASARQLGRAVTIAYPDQVPLERVLGAEVGAIFRDVQLEHAVELLPGTRVAALEGTGKVERVRTEDGRVIDCDAVVVGIGARPRTELAAAADLEVDNGVLVDERLQTSDPGIFAAGDAANHLHPLLGRLRIEHWDNAREQGRAAARPMLGSNDAYERIPYFFSDQYDVGMEYAGHATRWDRIVFRGDPASRKFIVFWLLEGRVLAGMNVNVWDVNDAIKALVLSGQPLDERKLADPEVPLAELVPADRADGVR